MCSDGNSICKTSSNEGYGEMSEYVGIYQKQKCLDKHGMTGANSIATFADMYVNLVHICCNLSIHRHIIVGSYSIQHTHSHISHTSVNCFKIHCNIHRNENNLRCLL